MVEDYTKEEFHRLVTECQKKYEKKVEEFVPPKEIPKPGKASSGVINDKL